MFTSHYEVITETLVVLSFILGYYVGHRGISGVVSDLEDIKTDVENLKTKVFGSATTVTPSVTAT